MNAASESCEERALYRIKMSAKYAKRRPRGVQLEDMKSTRDIMSAPGMAAAHATDAEVPRQAVTHFRIYTNALKTFAQDSV